MSAAARQLHVGQLEYREEGHQYLLNGRVLTHITQVTDYFGGFGDIPADVRDRALAFGRAVHFACELEDRGQLDEATCAPRVLACVQQWRQFKADTRFHVLANEAVVYHPALDYAGRLDRRGRLNGKHAIVEIKTGSPYPVAGPQTAAQAMAAEWAAQCEPIEARYSIHLNPDRPRAVLIPHRDPSDRDTFMAMLKTWRWVKAHA